MPGSSTAQRGNESFAQILYITVTPPASVVTATQTQGTVVVPGILPGDLLSWNLLTTGTNYNALLVIETMFVTTPNNLTISWTSTGATIAGAGPQNILMDVTRSENFAVSGLAGLPNAIV